jgi:hypothetical protein
MTRHTTDPARLSSREAHYALWCLALLLGPEDENEWQIGDGINVHAHEQLQALADFVARADRERSGCALLRFADAPERPSQPGRSSIEALAECLRVLGKVRPADRRAVIDALHTISITSARVLAGGES